MLNALTIDVEDYFQVTAFERHVRRDEWGQFPLRVERNTGRILDLLDEYGVRATFFVLGWIAERAPRLVKEIQRRGHEIACHGYGHQLIYRIGPDKFREDIATARAILEQLCGERVCGYRAPSYSITRKSLWALDILIEEGFTYDSSIFPVIHDTYGIPDASRFPGRLSCAAGDIREFPLSTLPVRLIGKEFRLPIAGGGYLRLFPSWVIGNGIARINELERQPAVLYFHPWEIDPDQPRIQAGFKSRFRHYLNLHRTEQKLKDLLGQLQFGPMRDVLDGCIP
ncbi:polysaccharide deacetylase [Geotalea uraniireducens]|uniref:Polysaccharide deacetylase n=1 Tax=Geotalea uraniireducens TaxID=351604 RepID=A0ABM8EKL4_9BACT|nr:XrtA system polysaccharide deacetylase [Geotalea uraniireducens]BDV43047.1 polysaccharide deacetylase [Geotalea uraniireducens]